jgi:hypothetical protein
VLVYVVQLTTLFPFFHWRALFIRRVSRQLLISKKCVFITYFSLVRAAINVSHKIQFAIHGKTLFSKLKKISLIHFVEPFSTFVIVNISCHHSIYAHTTFRMYRESSKMKFHFFHCATITFLSSRCERDSISNV